MAYLSNILVKDTVYEIAAKLDSKGQNIEETYSTKDEVAQKLADLVGSAPETLDTLKELSDALGEDPNFATTISTKLGLKVDKEDGKGLSTEDFTTALKELLEGIPDTVAAKYTKPSTGIPKTDLASDVLTSLNKADSAIQDISSKLDVSTYNTDKATFALKTEIPTTLPASDVSAWAKAATKPTYTAAEVGLGKVDNTADKDKPISTATLTALNNKVDKEDGKSLVSDTEIIKLTNLPNKTDLDKSIADAKKAGTDAQTNLSSHTSNTSNPHNVTKALVGLGSVDNTADKDKPISTATQTALNAKVDAVSGKSLSTNDYTTAEKTKLAGIAEGANKYVHPSYTAVTSGLYKVAVDSTGHISSTTAVTKSDITNLGIPAQDTTYSNATTSANGLMSSTDKTKLDSIENEANKYTLPTASASVLGGVKVGANISINEGVISVPVDSELSETSTNPVQNKTINSNISNISNSINSINSSISSISSTIAEMSCVYGVRHYYNNSSPVLTRIGTPNLHVTLPVQSLMKRCILADDGTVVYYLDPNDSTKKVDGTDAVLDGTDGQVMVEVPAHYRRCTLGSDYYDVEISLVPFTNAKKINKFYVSAYEAALDRTNLKLASVVNTTELYRGGNNTASWDGTYRSLLGMPVTAISTVTFHSYGTKRGTGWDMYEIDIHDTLAWLFYIEYATLNCLTAYNSELTTEGYHQGGLGAGVTVLPSGNWGTYNSYNPVIPCGTTNSLGNNSGVVACTVIASDEESTAATELVPSYRGIENPYAHIWKWTVGYMGVGDGTNQLAYRCRNRSQYSTGNLNSYYTKVGAIAGSVGWTKTIIKNEYGDIIPTGTGASDSTYFSGYLWEAHNNNSIYAALVGGSLYGSGCGFGCLALTNGFGGSASPDGSRLCFCEKNLIIEDL